MYHYKVFQKRHSCTSSGVVRIDQHLDQRSSAILIRHIELNTDQASEPFTVDKKLVANFNRRIEKLYKICESPRIQDSVLVVKTPPYILTTLADVAELLTKIFYGWFPFLKSSRTERRSISPPSSSATSTSPGAVSPSVGRSVWTCRPNPWHPLARQSSLLSLCAEHGD